MREAWIIAGAVAFLYALAFVYVWAWETIPFFDVAVCVAFYAGFTALVFTAINGKGK